MGFGDGMVRSDNKAHWLQHSPPEKYKFRTHENEVFWRLGRLRSPPARSWRARLLLRCNENRPRRVVVAQSIGVDDAVAEVQAGVATEMDRGGIP
jgi:hypothetical protein